MSNTSDKGTMFGDGAVGWYGRLRSSPKVSTSSPLVSPSSIINVPRELYSIDVAATFGVPLTTVGDLQKLINDIDAGKHDELLSELTNEDRMETLEALGSICNSIKVDRNNADVIPCKVSCGWLCKGSTYVIQLSYLGGGSRILIVLTFSIPSIVLKRNNWVKHGLKRIMIWTGLEAVLEGGLWLIRKSLIILKKWSMDTRLLKEELTLSVYMISWGMSSFARCLIEVNSEADLVDVVTIGIPSLSGVGFTKETIRVEYE
ncbi:hypothetical protein Tco_0642423 [Tanacetum coccineum]